MPEDIGENKQGDQASIGGNGEVQGGDQTHIQVGDIHAEEGSQVVVAGRDVNIVQRISNFLSGDIESQRALRNRQNMLKLVWNTWIEGVLKKSLYDRSLIDLSMQSEPEAVEQAWEMVIRDSGGVQDLEPGARLLDLYDQANGALLILGDPGSGKTTVLLELARQMIESAVADPLQPIPVVFSLSSWNTKLTLPQWLVEEINSKYFIARKLATTWVENNDLLLLLDGLDEVPEERRNACVEAINSFRQQNGAAMVVCSRWLEYQALPKKLALHGAIRLLPLDRSQIDEILAGDGDRLRALSHVLREDVELRQLAASPLMLNIMSQTFQEAEELSLPESQSENRYKQLLDAYIERMFKRTARSQEEDYTSRNTLEWLNWLAGNLIENRQTIFVLEKVNENWLDQKGAAGILWLAIGVLIGLFVGLVGGAGMNILIWLWDQSPPTPIVIILLGVIGLLSGALLSWLRSRLSARFRRIPGSGVIAGLLIGGTFGALIFSVGNQVSGSYLGGIMLGGMIGIFVGGLVFSLGEQPTEKLSWSWRSARMGLLRGAGFGILGGLLFYLLITLIGGFGTLETELGCSTTSMIFFGILAGLTGFVIGGLQGNAVEAQNNPGQGLARSIKHALVGGLSGGVAGGFLLALASFLDFAMMGGLYRPEFYAIMLFLIIGSFITGSIGGGLVGLVRYGGGFLIYHFSLRALLVRQSGIPWRILDFFEYAEGRIFLRQVGGGYIFIHRVLMEHFAEMDEKKIEALVKRIG